MLEKLITNLKQSLPEALQKKLGNQTTNHDSDDHDDEDDKTSVEVRYEGFDDEEIAELQDEDESESRPVARSEDAEEKKKKQISMAIRVGVILVLAYLVVDEFVLKKPETAVQEAQTEVNAVAGNPQEAQSPEEAPAITETTVSSETQEAPPTTTDENSTATPEAPVENINIAQSENPAEETINIEESLNSPSANESSSSLDFGQLGVSESTSTQTDSSEASDTAQSTDTTSEPSLDSSFGQIGEGSSSQEKSKNDTFNYGMDEADDLATPSLSENNEIDSKIIDSPVETLAPNYENTGRGLVYNCVDKHWACIDKPSYVQCHKNNVWNKSQGKRVECATKAVYNEDADCTKVQLFYVSNNEDTGFCN